MYPDPRVEAFINDNFIPARFHVKTHPEAMGRFGVDWTPTILILDSEGPELHRIRGELALSCGEGLAVGRQYFQRAFELANRQASLSWALRAATTRIEVCILKSSTTAMLAPLNS